MHKRAILTIAAVAAGPVAAVVQPAVARAADCIVAKATDTTANATNQWACAGICLYSTPFLDIPSFPQDGWVAADIEKPRSSPNYGSVWLCAAGSSFQYMRGVVNCQGGAPFYNAFEGWQSESKPTASPDQINCPAGFTVKSATAYLYDATKSCPPGNPG